MVVPRHLLLLLPVFLLLVRLVWFLDTAHRHIALAYCLSGAWNVLFRKELFGTVAVVAWRVAYMMNRHFALKQGSRYVRAYVALYYFVRRLVYS